MRFELPHKLTQWNHSRADWGLELLDDVKEWLISFNINWQETIHTDGSRRALTKVMFIDIERPADAMLFKLTWM